MDMAHSSEVFRLLLWAPKGSKDLYINSLEAVNERVKRNRRRNKKLDEFVVDEKLTHLYRVLNRQRRRTSSNREANILTPSTFKMPKQLLSMNSQAQDLSSLKFINLPRQIVAQNDAAIGNAMLNVSSTLGCTIVRRIRSLLRRGDVSNEFKMRFKNISVFAFLSLFGHVQGHIGKSKYIYTCEMSPMDSTFLKSLGRQATKNTKRMSAMYRLQVNLMKNSGLDPSSIPVPEDKWYEYHCYGGHEIPHTKSVDLEKTWNISYNSKSFILEIQLEWYKYNLNILGNVVRLA